MSDPFKLRALKALTAALKEITPANEYVSDLSDIVTTVDAEDPEDPPVETDRVARVYRGRAWFGADDPIPMVSILEGISPADEVAEPPIGAVASEYDWPILVQGFVDDDPHNPTDPAYQLMADVRQRIAVEQVRKVEDSRSQHDPLGLGRGKNRIERITIGSGVVRPADDVSAKAWFWLSLTLRVVENAADPYV